MNPLVKADFSLHNEWTPYKSGPKWAGTTIPAYLIDRSTGRSYWNESKAVVRVKCALLTLGTPIVHATVGLATKLFSVITLYPLWGNSDSSLKSRFKELGKEIIRLALLPLGVIALEMAALYGIFSPYNGRKVYASLERSFYGEYLLAPCFQPDPTRHLFGSDPNKRNVF